MGKISYMRELQGRSQEEIRRLQEARLSKQLRYCYDHSEFYQAKFDDCGAKPEEIRTIEDLRKLPVFMVKDDERKSAEQSLEKYGHPFGLHLCAPPEDLYLTGTTSGTTGMPTFSYTFTEKDMAFLTPRIGHRMSMAGTELFARFLALTRPTYMACTPSLAEYLIGKAPELLGYGVENFKFKGVLTTGEVGIAIPEIKKKMESAYGCRFYDYWAPCGNAPGISCDAEDYYGLHAIAPDVCTSFDDLVDPVTKRPVDADVDGAIGEMVQTNLQREACPVVKYAYGDIVQVFLKECPGCGFRGRRIKVVGRADDMLIVKGVNVYPAAIRNIVTEFIPEVTGEMRIVLDNPPPRVVPPLKLKIEHGKTVGREDLRGLEEKIGAAIHNRIKIRPVIDLVEPESLPRETRKTQVFEKKYKL